MREDVTVYVGGLYELRRTATGTAVHAFSIVGGDGPVAQVSWATDAGGQVTAQKVLYLHSDHQGSVETITDEAGGIFERLRYEPFGGRRHSQSLGSPQTRSNARVRQGFTGHEHDEEVGLINMKGRMYDPVLGRFLSLDPFMVGPRTSQALNRYSYVLNNPLRYTDPMGFETNELPVIVYDSWYGGYAPSASTTLRGSFRESGRCSGEGSVREFDVDMEIVGPRLSLMPAEFLFFLRRTHYSAALGMSHSLGAYLLASPDSLGQGGSRSRLDLSSMDGPISTGLDFSRQFNPENLEYGFEYFMWEAVAPAVDWLSGIEGQRAPFGDIYGQQARAFMVFAGVSKNGPGNVGLAAATNAGPKVGQAAQAAVQFDPKRAEHIFRGGARACEPTINCVPEPFARLFEQVASNPANLRPDAVRAGLMSHQAAQSGVQACTWAGNGGQVWVTVRNGVIQNAGVNSLGSFR